MRNRIPILIVIPVCFIILIFCMIYFRGCTDNKETVYYSSNEAPDNLIPNLIMNEEAKHICELIFDGLVNKTVVSDSGREQYEWALVEKVGFVRKSFYDRDTIYLHLRKGVPWHDGREFIAEDVIYSWKAIQASNSPIKGWLKTFVKDIQEVEGNNYKIMVKLKAERSQEAFMELFSPVKILPRTYNYDGKRQALPYNLNDGSEIAEQFKWKPVGTGPYKIADRTQERIKLEVHENEELDESYYLGRPEIKNIVMKVEKDPYKAVKGLKGKQLGLLFDVKPYLFDVLEDAPLQYQTYLPYGFYAIVYNTQRGPFDNIYFRKAVNSATDKNQLADFFLAGLGIDINQAINTGIFPSSSMYVQESLKSFQEGCPYNLNNAKRFLGRSDSLTRQFRLLVCSTLEGETRILELIKGYEMMMKEIGVTVIIEDETIPRYKDKINRRDFDAVLKSFSGFDHLYDIRSYFSSSGEENYWGIYDKKLSRHLEEFGKTIDLIELNEVSIRIHDRIEELTPACFLFNVPRRAYYSNKLEAVTVHPEVGFSTIEKWKIKHDTN